jgi:alkylation response protein AidB-like acyl-CoA dehydrogenase
LQKEKEATVIQFSSAERDLLIGSLRQMLQSSWPVEHAVELASDADAVRGVVSELSALSLTELGAPDGLGVRDTLAIFEELGRASCPVPLVGVFIANRLLHGATDAAIRDLVASVGDGKAVPAVALAGFDGDPAAGSARVAEGRIFGSMAFVEGVGVASHLLVFTDAPGLALVRLDEAGVRVTPTPGLAVPPLSAVELDAPIAGFVACDADRLAGAAALVRLGSAARAHGSARRAFELAVDHAKSRKQFGHVIGEFQAIQHKLADCMTTLDGTQLALYSAACAYDVGNPHWRVFVDAAIAFAGPALRQVLLEVHHTLGAIGFAEEHEVPRHFRSVHADLVRFGGAARARTALADHLLAENRLPSHDADEQVIEFRRTVREWLATNWTGADREANRRLPIADRRWSPEFSRKMGAAGWLGLDWPTEFGGQARSAAEQLAFIEEFEFAEAPADCHTLAETIVGPAIIDFGSEQQQKTFLPAFLRGERPFALHYSEPEAGSDLAALRTAARRDGDEWVISGQKLWSTYGDRAEYSFLAARTDPDAKPKHAGISVFLVPLDTPGISIRPSIAMYGGTFSATFYDEVRLPGDALLGPENGGWMVLTSALAAERVMIGHAVAHLQHVFAKLVDHLRRTGAARRDPVVCDRIGALAAGIEIARQFTLRNAELTQAGRTPIYEAAMSKVFVGELLERVGEAGLDILGSGGLLSEEAPGAPLGEMEWELRHSMLEVLGGGTSEIQRNIIALRGLGLPRMS